MITTVDRAGWNARPPRSTTPLTRSRIKYFITHYSGEVRTQSVRSIQDYCMDVKKHIDIDYNDLVRDGVRFIGRGWNIGGHTLNHNAEGYGVCVIGRDGDATDADMTTVRAIYDEVCDVLGRQLIKTTHRGLLGASYTDCPGDELHRWVMSGMPYLGVSAEGVINMFFLQVKWSQAVYVSDGIRTRNMPAGTYETMIKPLVGRGVPFLTFASLETLLDAGGPLIKTDAVVPGLPSEVKLTIPASEIIARLTP